MFGKVISGLFGTKKPSIPDDKLQEHMDELRGYIVRDLRGGFASPDEIVGNALDVLSDECDANLLRPHAERIFAEVTRSLQAEQLAWPPVTDCDRLEQAFSSLEAAGIVCRQNFTCCGTCGSSEIWDEIDEVRSAGAPVHGYAFFHMQDTESAVDGYGLYLAYGAVEDGERAAVDVGRRIADEVSRAGLQVDWDGSWAKRIGVKLDWKRRVPA